MADEVEMEGGSEGRRSLEDFLAAQEAGRAAPSLDELLPELSHEEQERIHQRRRRDRRFCKNPPSPTSPDMRRSEQDHDSTVMPHVIYALRHYNAKHLGSEFDAVKPIKMRDVSFKGDLWYHVNFWARSRSSNKIKRFFAEIHYKTSGSLPPLRTDLPLPPQNFTLPVLIPVVESCMIIEEPLSQYNSKKSWCAFCPILDILHPVGNRKFVCGNSKEHSYQQLSRCHSCIAN